MLPNVNVVNRALFFPAYGMVAPIGPNDCNTFDPAKRAFGLVTSTLDEDNVAWRVALDWTPAEGVLVFGSISRGAKAGATPINAANISTQNAPATQELLTAYEVGVKAALFERRVQANVSAFYYDYEDKQLSSTAAKLGASACRWFHQSARLPWGSVSTMTTAPYPP